MHPVAARNADLLTLWATLAPEDRVQLTAPSAMTLTAAGLRPAGPGNVARRPSWLLPARHPAFAFGNSPVAAQPAAPVTLWRNGAWQPADFARMMRRLATRNWWLLHGGHSSEQVAAKLTAAGGLPQLCRAHVNRLLPGIAVTAVFVIGSYLWADRPSSRVDVVAVVDGRDEALLHHVMDAEIPPRQQWSIAGRTIEAIDLLVVSMTALRHPSRLTGQIGKWMMGNGLPYPYDTRRETVARALMGTLRSGVLVDGVDPLHDDEQSTALLCLAYYFVQEASILLTWRQRVGKAASRLLEASLILDQVKQGRDPTSCSGNLASLASAVRAREDDAQLLSDLQGWHGRRPRAALPNVVDRLTRARITVPAQTKPGRSLDALLQRAIGEDWPTWRQAQTELEGWLVPPADTISTIRRWHGPRLSASVRRHLDALGVTGPEMWLGDPWDAMLAHPAASE